MWDSKGESQKETKQTETRLEDVQSDRESWRHTLELGKQGRGTGGHRVGQLLDPLPMGGWGRGKRREGEEGQGVGLRGRDSYSRAEGPPSIIFKPLQPTLELVEIKHRITGISTSVPETTTPQTDSHGRMDGRTDRQECTMKNEAFNKVEGEGEFSYLTCIKKYVYFTYFFIVKFVFIFFQYHSSLTFLPLPWKENNKIKQNVAPSGDNM